MILWFSVVFICVLSSLFTHAVLCRLFVRLNAVLLFIVAGAILGFSLIVFSYLQYGLLTIESLSLILFYIAFCELYLFLFTLSLSSVSANILVRLNESSLQLVEIDKLYDSNSMVEQRVLRMHRTGLLVENNGLNTTTQKGLLLVSLYRTLRRFFRHI